MKKKKEEEESRRELIARFMCSSEEGRITLKRRGALKAIDLFVTRDECNALGILLVHTPSQFLLRIRTNQFLLIICFSCNFLLGN